MAAVATLYTAPRSGKKSGDGADGMILASGLWSVMNRNLKVFLGAEAINTYTGFFA